MAPESRAFDGARWTPSTSSRGRGPATIRWIRKKGGGKTVACANPSIRRADVAIVGAGIIGLHIASDLLEQTTLSVAVVERANNLCAGATGAGQGYLWQLHRDPLNVDSWKMAELGRERWRRLAAEDPAFSIDVNGSLLLATTPEELEELKSRVHDVNKALSPSETFGAVFLPTREHVVREEPALGDSVAPIVGGAMLRSDSQIDGQATTKAMFAKCNRFSDRFQAHFGAEVERLVVENGTVKGLACANGLEISAGAVCVCAGAWTSNILSPWSDASRDAIVPRRGHLIVVSPNTRRGQRERCLNHGIMESSYSKHYLSMRGDGAKECDEYDITFTATQSVDGTLLVGSSRELCAGFDQSVNPLVVKDILDSAREYLPTLLEEGQYSVVETRVGLRPYRRVGPRVGPVEGVAGLYVAAGHEGSGLTLAPATAEVMLRLLAV